MSIIVKKGSKKLYDKFIKKLKDKKEADNITKESKFSNLKEAKINANSILKLHKDGIINEKNAMELAELSGDTVKNKIKKELKRGVLLSKQQLDDLKKVKKTMKKKGGGRLNDGTAFIKSLYKDKL